MSGEKEYKLHYHLRSFDLRTPSGMITGSPVSITAIVKQNGKSAILSFGFSRVKNGDNFSKKYGRSLTTLRAEQDPTLVVGFRKEFAAEYFMSVAVNMGKEVAFHTNLGNSLISDLQLPEKTKVKPSEEQVAQWIEEGSAKRAARNTAESEE